MAVILFTWEFGGGLGHIMQLAPLANHLIGRGHRVYAALRETSGAAGVFHRNVQLLPAPVRYVAVAGPPTNTFIDIIEEITFGDDSILAAHVCLWRNLFGLVRPELIVFDHSPTAMLAARGIAAKRLLIGNGFTAPPDVFPLPDLRPWAPRDPGALRARERAVLSRANRVVGLWKKPPLDRIGQLYSEVDDTLLATFRELDPYSAARPAGARYLGPVNAGGGKTPAWPAGDGKRIYAYLRPFPALPALLELLAKRSIATVAYISGIDARLRNRFASSSLRIEDERLNLDDAAMQCDLAITNGNLATVSAVLLAGRPALHIPIYFEHALNARAVVQLGAGLSAPPRQGELIVRRLEGLMSCERFRAAAARVAKRYRGFDRAQQQGEMLARLDALLG